MRALAPTGVLVIEDDPDTCANLCDILALDGYQVETAGTARAALARDNWPLFFAILLDRRLPDSSAEELLPRLRSLAPDVAIIVITAHGDLAGAVAAIRHGAADYILKPINADALRSTLARIAEHCRLAAEKARAEEALRESEARYRRLIETANEGIWTVDAENRISYVNRVLSEMLGYTAQELLGHDALALTFPEDRARAERRLRERRQGRHEQGEIRLRRRDGSPVWVQCNASPIVSEKGEFIGDLATMTDVTERRRAEIALRESEARFRTLVEAAACMIVILRRDHTIAYFSPFAEELTGYDRSGVLGEDYSTLFLSVPYQELVAQEIARIFSGGAPSQGFENPIRCRDGSSRWIVWNARLLEDFEGAPAVLGVGQDITKLKDAQERGLQSERLAAIGQMMAGLAHESRNALQRSQACLEMLALEVSDRPQAIELVTDIQKAQDHLHHLYEEVRGYAAPIRLKREPCDLGRLLEETWAHLELARKNRDARLLQESHGVDRHSEVDAHSISQVFRNILENALNACADPVLVRVRWSEFRDQGQPALCVALRDNGPGLTPEARRGIFEPFYTTKIQGTGLGMPIAKRIVEAHGGRIELGPANGPGAELIITLPRR